MLRFQIFQFYIYLIALSSTLGSKRMLSSSDLCTILPCNKSDYDDCDQNSVCNGKYSYRCSETKCSINKIKCTEFNQVAYALSLARTISEYKFEVNKFISFNAAIQKCPLKIFKWKESHICLNQIKCSYKKISNIGNSSISVLKKRLCPCINSHIYSCGNYCSINKKSCAIFTFQIKKDQRNFTRNIC